MIGVVLAHNDHHDMDGWDWVWGSLMMVLILAVVVLVVWAIVRGTQHIGGHPHHRAREILAERLARGEINAQEYRELSQQL